MNKDGDIATDLKEIKSYHKCSWMEELIIFRWWYHSKCPMGSKESLWKIPTDLFIQIERLILKFTKNFQGTQIIKTILIRKATSEDSCISNSICTRKLLSSK